MSLFNEAERAAIVQLCPDSSVARALLGEVQPFPEDMRAVGPDRTAPVVDRVRWVAGKLKGYLVSMAAEAREYDDVNESERLGAEAVGLLLALRDLHGALPELDEQGE